MLAFNFLMAFRSMLKNKVTSLINLFGLTASFTALLLILMFVIQELSYDRYHIKADRIFRISREGIDASGNAELHFGHVNYALAEHLRREFPDEVERAIRFNNSSNTLVSNEMNRKSFVETSLFFADPGVFDVFSWNLVKGNRETVLTDINTVAISESVARRYFEDADPIGKMLLVNGEIAMQVTGVFEDVPGASHFKPTMLMSMATREKLDGYEDLMRNQSNNDATYVLLKEGANLSTLKEQMPMVLDRFYELGSDGRKSSQTNRYYFWPLKNIHLQFVYDSSTEPNGNYMVVYVFMGTALLILLIACINFINLSTARLSQRAKEVGLKKAIGALRVTLFSQFIAEAFLFALFSLVLAMGLAYLLLPSFNTFLGKELSLMMIATGPVLLAVSTMLLLVSFIAGGYPAWYLSAFKAADVLKKGVTASWKGLSVRSVLVGVQFFLAFLLIIAAVVVSNQMRFVNTYNVGFDRSSLLVLPSSQTILQNFKSVKQQLEQHPGIVKVSICSRVPSGRLADAQEPKIEVDGKLEALSLRISDVHVDHDYFNVLGLPIVAGRNFDYALASDSMGGFILNETAVKAIGWKSNEDAIGKVFHYGSLRKGTIIGVVKDFNFESLHEPIKPAVFVVVKNRGRSVIMRVDESKKEEVLKYLAEQWSYWRPGFPFSSYTLSDNFEKQYENEQRAGKGVSFFAAFAIFISSLGVFGLALFMAEQRTKEMGIRKALGANTGHITLLLGKWFFILMLAAGTASIPLSYWLASGWLETFAFSSGIGCLPYILAFGIVALFTILSVAVQIFRTARQNPVKALRYE